MRVRDRLIGVQYLRALAALMVTYYHLIGQIPAYSHDLAFARILSSERLPVGVDIFFAISGFIMYVTGRTLPAGEFAWRRLTRIVPLYWMLTLALCAIGLIDSESLRSTDISVGYFVKSLLFIPYHNPTHHGLLFPLLNPGWTLNYEMAFYAVFAVALLLPRYRMFFVGGILSLLTMLGVVCGRPEMLSLWGFYTSSRLALFAAGIALGWMHERSALRIPRWLCAALILVGGWGVLTAWAPMADSGWAEIASAMSIVAGVIAWEQQFGIPRWRPLLVLGDASYSVYLMHLFAFGMIRSIWKHTNGSPWAFATIAMCAAIALALVTYYGLERPSIRLAKHISEGRKRNCAQRIVSSLEPDLGTSSESL